MFILPFRISQQQRTLFQQPWRQFQTKPWSRHNHWPYAASQTGLFCGPGGNQRWAAPNVFRPKNIGGGAPGRPGHRRIPRLQSEPGLHYWFPAPWIDGWHHAFAWEAMVGARRPRALQNPRARPPQSQRSLRHSPRLSLCLMRRTSREMKRDRRDPERRSQRGHILLLTSRRSHPFCDEKSCKEWI